MTAPWTATLNVGDLELESAGPLDGQIPLVPGTPQILDGLRCGWSMADDGNGLWPTQPPPTNLRFSLVAAHVEDLDSVNIGAHVFHEVYAGVVSDADVPFPSVRFAGRVADLTARPRRVAGRDGWQLDVICADYTADLAETDVAGYDGQQGVGVQTHIRNLFELAGIPAPDWDLGGEGAEQLVLDNGRIPSTTLAEAVDRYLRTYADGGPLLGPETSRANHAFYPLALWRRGIVRQKLDDILTPTGQDPVTPYRIEWVTARHGFPFDTADAPTGSDFPAKLGVTEEDGWGAVIEAPPVDPIQDYTSVIDAGYVDFDAQLRATKATAPTRVVVTNNAPDDLGPTWTAVALYRRPRDVDPSLVRITDCRAVHSYNAEFVAEMYLGDVPVRTMQPDKFTWYASRDPSWPSSIGWFPDLATWRGHAHPVVVNDLPASQAPDGEGRRWHAGILSSVEWAFRGGEFLIEFSLRPGAPRPFRRNYLTIHPGAVTFEDIEDHDGSLAGITFDDLHHTQTYADWRLIRTPRLDYPANY